MTQKIVTLSTAIELLKNGGVGVMPSDTVYGLVAHAFNEAAVTRMYALKSRERKPGTLIASSTDQLESLGVPKKELEKVAKWWPNPLSAVLIMNGNEYLHQGVGDIAMRVVKDDTIRSLLEQTGPLITSSANLPGEPNATTITEAIAYFSDSVDFYVDGGVRDNFLPSTIIKPSKDGIAILRQGDVHI